MTPNPQWLIADNIPVQQPDDSTWGQRFWDFLRGGGPWGTAQPGQRGAWVPSRINEQGRPELAAPEMALNAADVIQNLPRVGFAEIMRDPDGNRDLIRRLAEGSFDGVYSDPDDQTTAAILALLTQQYQGAQPQQ